jgi:hypothetical protein
MAASVCGLQPSEGPPCSLIGWGTRKEEEGRRKESAPQTPSSSYLLPASFSEADLARLWRDQTFPAEALVTGAGDQLRVIYRGRPGSGAGPDFRDALIAAAGGLLQGDVELHVRSSDFRRHGHDRDPAYAGIVLHLVFRDDEGCPTSLPGGGVAAVVALGDWARGRTAEIERWLERPALWREPCFSSPRRLGVADVKATLERLGEMRFRQKAAAFARRFRDMGLEGGRRKQEGGRGEPRRPLLPSSSFLVPDVAGAEQVLWEALLETLAYGSAREEFRLLAQRLPWAQLRARLAALPARRRSGEAWRLLAAAAGTSPFFGHASGRPAGRPERRLEGAAQLAARLMEKGLLQAFVDVLEKASGSIEENQARRERPKIESGANHGPAAFRVSSCEFRAGDPGRSESGRTASLIALVTVPGLIGRSRAVEIIGNAVLPCLAALGPEARRRLAEALYRRLPLPARYGAVRHLHQVVGGAMAVDFRRQQGMLYLLKQYCTQGGCGRCPLS